MSSLNVWVCSIIYPLMVIHDLFAGDEPIPKRLQERLSVFWEGLSPRKVLSYSNSVPPGHKSLSLKVIVLFKHFGLEKKFN